VQTLVHMTMLAEQPSTLPALPEWARTVLRLPPGASMIDGVVSTRPEKRGDYMTGDKWPDVTEKTPFVRGRASTGFEFAQTVQMLRRTQREPGPLRILSVGDGGGNPSAIIVDQNEDVRVFAVELSLDALLYFFPKTLRFFKTPADRIVRLHASAFALPFVDGCLDAVVGSCAIHHFQLLTTFMREAHRVLRPGGYVHFIGELVWSGRDPKGTSEEDIFRSKGQYRRALAAGGFTDLEVGIGTHELHRMAARTRTPYALWRGLRHIVPTAQALIRGEANVSVRGMRPVV
jgi:SAM-dependent methyltransferase